MKVFNAIQYHCDRLNITPKDISIFSGLSQSKLYRLATLHPTELPRINYYDKRAIERALNDIEGIANNVLELDTYYKSSLGVLRVGGDIWNCSECNTPLLDRDLIQGKYSELCPNCNSDKITDL
jgi:rubrerythrin